MTNAWRRVVAALANERQRAAYARAVLGLPADDARAVAGLRAAGLLDERDAVTTVFGELLAEHPVETKQGVERWLREGRIDHYPARPAQRRELLEWVAARALATGEELDEKSFGERLAAFSTDVATLRRYLVDAGLVTRSDDGSRYSG